MEITCPDCGLQVACVAERGGGHTIHQIHAGPDAQRLCKISGEYKNPGRDCLALQEEARKRTGRPISPPRQIA
jgi:hypothetical protein